jgi:hypothetical protein
MKNLIIIVAIISLTCLNKPNGKIYSTPYIPMTLIEDTFTLTNKEWYAFSKSKLKYYYQPIKYTEKELNLLTNILYRESRISDTKNHMIDQYLVMICGIQTITVMKKHKSINDLIKNGTSFTMPKAKYKTKFNDANWVKCREICKNVLECKIPSFVPYVPNGTICYWNDNVDTNIKQKKHLESKYVCVASTIHETHYYCHIDYIEDYELKYLIDNDLQCNPIKKKISNGVLCN